MTSVEGAGDETDRIVAEVDKAMRASERSRAFELANAAILRGQTHPTLFSARALWYEEHYRFEDALADFLRVRALFPREPRLLVSIGLCHLRLDHWREALGAFEAAIASAPNFPLAHFRRGQALARLDDFPGAVRAYERAVALKPDLPGPLAGLALMAVRERNAASVVDYAQRALAIDPRQPTALVALAMLDMANGDMTSTETKLRAALEAPRFGEDPSGNILVGILADAFDRQDQVGVAFAAYVALNAKRRQIHSARYESVRAVDRVARLTRYFEQAAPWKAEREAAPALGAAAGHVFLAGFMRSGTTLLEAVLAGRPEIVALDERNCFQEATQAFLNDEAGLERLAALSDEELSGLRNAYWKAVRENGANVAGKVFVDKLPFHSVNLPLIARLFPDAKILFALRDPRDVVLSCFRNRFEMTAHSFEFFLLDDCARYYAAVMHLAKLCREKLPLNILLHRYEDMIENFDKSVHAVCDFIGIEWNDSMRDFREGARAIDPGGVSAVQVRQGLYKSAVGQWRRYGDQLAPVLPILTPWIEFYGYASE